jgi:hypothetical protein
MAQPGMKNSRAVPETESPQIPDSQQIASLAYALWQARGCPEGSPEEDWLKAEQELTTSR